MPYTKKNELLIGFTISVLLSLFVNSSLLIASYKDSTQHITDRPQHPFESQLIIFSIIWFFLFAFLLYLINNQTYKWGDRWFGKKEYKSILFSMAVSILVAFAVFMKFPSVYNLLVKDRFESYLISEKIELSRRERPVPQMHRWERNKDDEKHFKIMPVPPFPYPMLMEHLIVLLTIMLIVPLIRLLHGKQQMMLDYEKLKTEQLQASYNALMGQINPHFFFNSLNGLNSLIRNGEREQTLTYLDELSNVFRYILQSNKKELVTLAEELQFVKAYTYLLSVRYEGKLFFSIQADPPLLLWYLPILSILPLIENAVKHNVISKQYPLQIDIYTTTEKQLVVSNHIQPKIEDSHSSGIGLKNLWGRYRMLTGKDIQISNRKEYFKVSLPLLNTPVRS